MAQQPDGQVTLLFTDIEGSTRLLRALGPVAYRDALDTHRQQLRETFARHGGYEVNYEGDSFFVAFSDPGQALAAAGEAQQLLASGPIRVRIGLHTGRPLLDPPKYVGMDVHLAARIMAAGHGGQILLSGATHGLVDAPVRDLGLHRLKDFDEPVALYQLGPGEFLPLRTISNTNLPRPAGTFVGREHELADVVGLLMDGARLVTLSGPGGCGKTRLALEAAAEVVGEFPAGVFWVSLGQLREAGLVLDTIAEVLGRQDDLAATIGDRHMLLVIDNLEQVIEAAIDLARLLERCPNLALLVTSREVLRVSGEIHYAVPPLLASDATRLFCLRARVEADETVRRICRRLDYLPLAIELAAARASALSPDAILERLDHRLAILTRGARDLPPRQRSLRAAITWSDELLTPDQRRLFHRLAVFAGCTLDAASQVAGADVDTLQSLVDASLVQSTGHRFWMLETLREYAAERLADSGEEAQMRDRHAAWCMALAEDAEPHVNRADDVAWLDRLEAERDNFRAALDWASARGTVEIELRIASNLRSLWGTRGPTDEGQRRLEHAARLPGAALPVLRSTCLAAAAELAHDRGEYKEAIRLAEDSLVLAEATGDLGRVISATNILALGLAASGDLERAAHLMADTLDQSRRHGDPHRIVAALINNGNVALVMGEFGRAEGLFEAALREAGLGQGRGTLAIIRVNLAATRLQLGRLDACLADARTAIELGREVGDDSVVANGLLVIGAALMAKVPALGSQLIGAADAFAERAGYAFEPDARTVRDQAGQDGRAALGDQGFEAALARGMAMMPDDAVALALGDGAPIEPTDPTRSTPIDRGRRRAG